MYYPAPSSYLARGFNINAEREPCIMPGNLSSQAIHGCVMCETELLLEEETACHALHGRLRLPVRIARRGSGCHLRQGYAVSSAQHSPGLQGKELEKSSLHNLLSSQGPSCRLFGEFEAA